VRVLVDTTIWSLALRRPGRKLGSGDLGLREAWAELVKDGRVLMLGIIRQEVLSGIPDGRRFEELRRVLEAFPDEPVETDDHVRAARAFNSCRARGVQGSPVDFLICAMSERLSAPVFTTDRDFERYARHLPIGLFRPS
jgi:predicted nucleic acid-binding protein